MFRIAYTGGTKRSTLFRSQTLVEPPIEVAYAVRRRRADDRRRQLSSAIGSSILAHIPLDDRMEVLDFGAGTGLVSAQVAPRVHKIVAVDTSEAMLAALAAKSELRGGLSPSVWISPRTLWGHALTW